MKKAAIAVCTCLLLLLLFIGLRGAHDAYERRRAELEMQIAHYRAFSDAEAEYILRNQLDCGALLVYETEKRDHGYINPYFACQAVIGLLSDPTEERLKAAERYLRWHTEMLLRQNGRITDFDWEDGALTEKEPDSVDAYAGKYLTLLAAYVRVGGDIGAIGGWDKAVSLLLGILEDLSLGGCVFVDDGFRVAYLMDNAEVWQGCRAAAELVRKHSGDRDAARQAERFDLLADEILGSVETLFWDPDSFTYHVGISKSMAPVPFQGYASFYPDCIAQLYPAIAGLCGTEGRERALYGGICRHHDWEKGPIEDSTFDWSVMAYAAALFKDTRRLDSFLRYYADKAGRSRSYPMHTANAGWVMEACSVEIGLLREERDRSFFRFLLSGH